MKRPILFVFLALINPTLQSQSPSLHWARSMGGLAGEEGRGIAVDGPGNVYTTGYFSGTADFDPGPGIYTLTSSGSYEAFFTKLDASGTFLWAAKVGGSRAESGMAIAVDGSGNVYSSGTFQGSADFDPGPGVYTLTASEPFEVFICKLDENGGFVWARQLNLDNIEGLAVDASGNVYITGGFYATADFDPGSGVHNLVSAGQDDAYICKLNASGNFTWAHRLGSAGGDHGRSLVTDKEGNVYSTGNYENTVDFDPGAGVSNLTSAGGWDIFVQKLNSSGDLIWAQSIGGTGWDEGRSVSVSGSSGSNIDVAGGYELTCDFDPGPATQNLTSAGGYDAFVCRLDGSGNLVWVKANGGTGYDMAYCVASPGSYEVFSIGISGVSQFINVFNGAGTLAMSATLPGTFFSGRSLAADSSGNLYVTGSFEYTRDFDPGSGLANLTAVAETDIFVLKMAGGATGMPDLAHQLRAEAYPNPGQGIFNIVCGRSGPARLVVRNLSGTTVLSSHLVDKVAAIDLSSEPAGLYLLEIAQDHGCISTMLLKVE